MPRRSFRPPTHPTFWVALAMTVLLGLGGTDARALTFANTEMSYQGELFSGGVPANGIAQMRFVIYNESNGATLWSNDGTSSGGSQPSDFVSVAVTDGLFSIILGSGSQKPIDPESVWDAKSPVLRIWVDIGGQNEQLPDQPVRSTAVAMTSHSADVALDDFEAEGSVWSKSGGFKFPDGSVQLSAAVGVDGNSLDEAYDKGGPGQGRTVVADAGALRVIGPDGLVVDGGKVQLGDPNDAQADGRLEIFGGDSNPSIHLAGESGTVAMNVLDASGGANVVFLKSSLWFLDTDDAVYGGLTTAADLVLGTGAANDGSILLNGEAGLISLDSESGTISTGVLEITGGADLAEPFAMNEKSEVHPGSVVVIDVENPGQLSLCRQSYDRRVAGVVSGAGGVKAGLTLSQEDLLGGGQNVALNGRVYVKAEASSGPIQPGDLLTTSDLPGHARIASDRSRSHGAVIGKAMSSLDEGTGLVLVLVNLQ